MASTQVARAAAQLHEAALDVARVAALRSAAAEPQVTEPPAYEQAGLAEDRDGNAAGRGDVIAPADGPDVC